MHIETLPPSVSSQSTSTSWSAHDWRPGRAAPQRRKGKTLSVFLRGQQEKLLELRATLESSMNGIARATRLEKADSSALATHNGDAGSDACDRDFALSLLSQDTNALFEIDAALQRIEQGSYGICEISGQSIPVARLRAMPFARFTVECQAKIEAQRRLFRNPRSFVSSFAVADEEEGDESQEDAGSAASAQD
jgi:RNA polymerase-binding transcription factor DksA